MDDLSQWIGRIEVQRDVGDAHRMMRLAATLDHISPPWQPGCLPPLGHWLCFLPSEVQSQMGPDGHPRRSAASILPDVDLPRRMWAGSRVRFLDDIPLDLPLVRISTLTSATPKSGRSGRMLFVTIRHEIAVEGGAVAIVEDQDIVYREANTAGANMSRLAEAAGAADPDERTLVTDPVLMLRYSALTFNAHRIHYDREYARVVEGYPDLVVHGPLTATLLLDHLLRRLPAAQIQSFQFRAMSPLFVSEPVELGLRYEGDQAFMRAIGPAGVAMTAQAEFMR